MMGSFLVGCLEVMKLLQLPQLYRDYSCWDVSPTVYEGISLWGFGEVWSIFPGALWANHWTFFFHWFPHSRSQKNIHEIPQSYSGDQFHVTRWWFLFFCLFSPLPEMIQFDLRIFVQRGWFNHLEEVSSWFVGLSYKWLEFKWLKKTAGETKKSLQLLFKLCWVGLVPSIFWQKKIQLPGNSAGALLKHGWWFVTPELKGWNRDLQQLGIKLGHGGWITWYSHCWWIPSGEQSHIPP